MHISVCIFRWIGSIYADRSLPGTAKLEYGDLHRRAGNHRNTAELVWIAWSVRTCWTKTCAHHDLCNGDSLSGVFCQDSAEQILTISCGACIVLREPLWEAECMESSSPLIKKRLPERVCGINNMHALQEAPWQFAGIAANSTCFGRNMLLLICQILASWLLTWLGSWGSLMPPGCMHLCTPIKFCSYKNLVHSKRHEYKPCHNIVIVSLQRIQIRSGLLPIAYLLKQRVACQAQFCNKTRHVNKKLCSVGDLHGH